MCLNRIVKSEISHVAEKVETLFHFYLLSCGFLLIHDLLIFCLLVYFLKVTPLLLTKSGEMVSEF